MKVSVLDTNGFRSRNWRPATPGARRALFGGQPNLGAFAASPDRLGAETDFCRRLSRDIHIPIGIQRPLKVAIRQPKFFNHAAVIDDDAVGFARRDS